jgi:uncharacterized Zn finger protein
MTFSDLTWDDLEAWAGTRVVKRGKSYKGCVSDLCRTADGRLLAWVRGGNRYATEVRLSDAGKPLSFCTCPYGTACKHAVAVILSYLDAVQAKRDVPITEADDERVELLADEAEDCEEGDEALDEEDADDTAPVLRRCGAAAKRPPAAPSEVDAYLARLEKGDLLKLIADLRGEVPEIGKKLRERAELAVADGGRLVASARRAIREAAAEPGWSRHWSNESFIPDYSPVRKRLQALLDAGRADDVVALGEELVTAGLRQMGQSDDEGETGQRVAECLGIVFRALAVSSKSDADKLLWEVDVLLREDYGFFDNLPSLWSDPGRFPPRVWSEVADALAERMPTVSQEKKGDGADSHSVRYLRDKIRRWMSEALTHAGRADEITALLTREAEATDCYSELVDHLLKLDRDEEVEAWCRKGFEATRERLPGIAKQMRDSLHKIAEKKGDWPLVAAFRAYAFLDEPDVSTYQALGNTVRPLGLWEPVRQQMLAWLETGRRPGGAATAPAAKGKRVKGKATAAPDGTPSEPWPLPDTGLPQAGERGRYRSFPQTELLIRIALEEKRHDDALAWYERHKNRGSGGWGFFGRYGVEQSLAEAVCATHPDAALGIWRTLAEHEIAQTKPAAYEVAAGYLEQMKAVYERTEKTVEWQSLLSELRATHRPKRSLMAVLDRLEGKKEDRKIVR